MFQIYCQLMITGTCKFDIRYSDFKNSKNNIFKHWIFYNYMPLFSVQFPVTLAKNTHICEKNSRIRASGVREKTIYDYWRLWKQLSKILSLFRWTPHHLPGSFPKTGKCGWDGYISISLENSSILSICGIPNPPYLSSTDIACSLVSPDVLLTSLQS